MLFLKLEYSSPDLCVAHEMIEVLSKQKTQDLIAKVSQTIKIPSDLFKLSQKKDGYIKKIIEGWSLSHYDFESGDIVQLNISIPQQQFQEDDQCKDFLFRMSNSSYGSSFDQSELFENIQTKTRAKSQEAQFYEIICDLISRNEYKQVERILSKIDKVNDLNTLNSDGWSIIHHMAYFSCQKWFQFIRDNKCQININLETTDGWTPLQIAVRQQDFNGIKTLMQFNDLDVNQMTSKGSALHIACKIGDQNIIRFLIEGKSDPLQNFKFIPSQKDQNQQNSYQVSNQQAQNFLVSLQNGNQMDQKVSFLYLLKLSQYSQIKAIICKGSVVNPGNFIWQLKERFLVLNPIDGTLQRFKLTDQKKSIEILLISKITCIQNDHTQFGLSKDYKFTKISHGNNKSMIFGTLYQDQADRWITLIRQAIVYQKNVESKLQIVNLFVTPDVINLDQRENSASMNSSTETKQTTEVQNRIIFSPPLEKICVPQHSDKSKNKFSDFIIYKVLGQGSFGVVFLAGHKQSDQQYALKVMNKVRLIKKKQIKYAVNESKILALMDNPFVVKMSFAFQTPQNLYMALEYCTGLDLYASLSKLSRFKEDVARFYICEVMIALEYLHSKNIVYRDLKPENILLCEDGHIKLTDFGLSKLNVMNEINTKSFCGSPAYMSPETLLKIKTGKYVDYYALGIVLYELLTGMPPFVANQLEVIYEQIRSGVIKFPAYMSQQAKDLIKQLTNKDPYKRMNFENAKKHSFFKSIDWNRVINKQYPPPLQQQSPNPEKNKILVQFDDKDYIEEQDNQNKLAEFDFM